jgi:hypothetical protein
MQGYSPPRVRGTRPPPLGRKGVGGGNAAGGGGELELGRYR